MSKISKSLKAIGLIVKNPYLLNRILEDEKAWKQKVTKQYHFSSGLPVIKAEDIFGNFTETVDPFGFLYGGSLPTDLAILKKLARNIPNCSYFEIGTWRGESVANVATVAKECHTLNLSAEEMKSMGIGQKFIDVHGFFSKNIANVTNLKGNSRFFDFQSLNRKFDLIFIDGDHHYDLVKNDTNRVFKHLCHEKTIVVWHDYGLNPETVRWEVFAGILDGCPGEKHQNLFHFANSLCAVYLPGHTGGSKLDAPEIPQGAFKVELEYKKIIP